MFLGRGFAHVGVPPIYVGEIVLLIGLVAAGVAFVRLRPQIPRSRLMWLLVAFMGLGLARTLPFVGTFGVDALRDGVLWGYAFFALIIFVLADQRWVPEAIRLYGWVVPVFALWLPISWNLFSVLSGDVDPSSLGSDVPLVFFKGGDMAVHTVGSVAFLVLGASAVASRRTFLWRGLVTLPLLWTAFVAGTSNRGALLTVIVGVAAVGLLAPRSRNWVPLLAATAVFAIGVTFQNALVQASGSLPTPSGALTAVGSGSPEAQLSVGHSSLPSGRHDASPSSHPTETATGDDSTPDPAAGDPVFIPNSGFESGPLNNGTIEGWTPRGAGSHDIVAGGAYQGARFASVQNVARAYEDTLTSSRVPFRGGQDIAVSVWVKAIAARPVIEIYVNWYDHSGTLISTNFLKSLATNGVRTWQECAGALAAPATATQAEIVFYEASGRATIGIDEVTVRSGDLIKEPPPPEGRPATLQQLIENILSLFGSSSNDRLEGTKEFRLAWWGKIIDYTVFGDYFWTGKGFGVNLADADGFQITRDHSLRAPHNSHLTVLARMGVPGFVLWLLLQAWFGIGLLRSVLAHRRAGDARLAAIAAWLLVYWVAIMVDTSFDPFLEGPQGGIWFWVVFGMGMVVMRLRHGRSAE
jgi:hypothetical protein